MSAASSLHPVYLSRARPIAWPHHTFVSHGVLVCVMAWSFAWSSAPSCSLGHIAVSQKVCFFSLAHNCVKNNNSQIRSDERDHLIGHGDEIAQLDVQFEVGVAQTCRCLDRKRLCSWHFVCGDGPLRSTLPETRFAAGTAVSPHHPSHWLQQDARRLSCFLDPLMQLEPPKICNGWREGTLTCRYLTPTCV